MTDVTFEICSGEERFVGERAFLLPCAYTTKSGLQPVRLMERIRRTCKIMGTMGYLFFRGDTRKPQLGHHDEVFVEYLTRVQDSHPGLIPGELEVGCEFGLGGSGRRGLTTIYETWPSSQMISRCTRCGERLN